MGSVSDFIGSEPSQHNSTLILAPKAYIVDSLPYNKPIFLNRMVRSLLFNYSWSPWWRRSRTLFTWFIILKSSPQEPWLLVYWWKTIRHPPKSWYVSQWLLANILHPECFLLRCSVSIPFLWSATGFPCRVFIWWRVDTATSTVEQNWYSTIPIVTLRIDVCETWQYNQYSQKKIIVKYTSNI